jgi:hypothetical protein
VDLSIKWMKMSILFLRREKVIIKAREELEGWVK